MADPVTGATVQVLLEKLLSITFKRVSSSRDFNKNLEMLTQDVSMIQAFIHDFERPQVEDQRVQVVSRIQAFTHDVERPQVVDQRVQEWLKRLERVAEDAEYVFDECRYESLKAEVMKIRNKLMEKVRNFFSHTAFKYKMSRKINNIKEDLRAINQLAGELGLQSRRVPSRQIIQFQETISKVDPSVVVVGRDNDVADIKRKMLNIREDVDLCSIPIVGMGGLGKTTVAKRIFNDEEIKQNFENRVWLCLPEMSGTTKSFLEQIFESLTGGKLEVQNMDTIVKTLQDKLGEKRYLLVLDDLWFVDRSLWNQFMNSLRGASTLEETAFL